MRLHYIDMTGSAARLATPFPDQKIYHSGCLIFKNVHHYLLDKWYLT